MNLSSLSSFESFPYFTIEAVKQLLGEDSAAAGTVQTALYRWMKSNQIIQLKKGVYMTRRFYELHKAETDFSPAISTILIPQSYCSLEFVLQRYGILTETTYPISAITIKQPRVIENKIGAFTYRHIKKDLYYGFTISEYFGIPFALATVSKALFDYFYFRTRNSTEDIAEDLRLNLEEFTETSRAEFAEFIEMSKSRKMSRIYTNLRRTIWRP